MDLGELQAYGYFILTALMVIILYSYIYHLYKEQKTGVRDYEKYSKMALDDELDDTPVEAMKDDKKESK